MGKQLSNRDVVFAVGAELGDVARDRVFQAELARLHQMQHAGRGGHHFGERRQIEQRVDGHGLPARRQRAIAERFLVDDAPVVPHSQNSTGYAVIIDLLLDQTIDGREVGGVSCFCRGWGSRLFVVRGLEGKRRKTQSQKASEDNKGAGKFHLCFECVINRKQMQPGIHTMHTANRLLSYDLAKQDEKFTRAFAVLHAGVQQRAFPGASVAVAHRGKLVALKGLGHFTYEANSSAVTAATIYDLASLTKVLVTTALCMQLYDQGKFDLEQRVTEVLPEFSGRDARRSRITFRMLLAHSSGLPAYVRLFETAQSRDELLVQALQIPLAADPGPHAEYSDIGFILLGFALERITNQPLHRTYEREIRLPLGLTMGFKSQETRKLCPPTENDTRFRHRVIQGEVNDENAWLMDGVAGHAGCFGQAESVATF